MSKKHYQKLAEILRNNRKNHQLIRDMIDYLRSENPRFNEAKFRSVVFD